MLGRSSFYRAFNLKQEWLYSGDDAMKLRFHIGIVKEEY